MMATSGAIDEPSLRYPGWRVVLACFLVALFIFGFGLYGHAVYLILSNLKSMLETGRTLEVPFAALKMEEAG
jgi:hypothetical protein